MGSNTSLLFLKNEGFFRSMPVLPSIVFLCASLWNSWEAQRKTECQENSVSKAYFKEVKRYLPNIIGLVKNRLIPNYGS